MKSKLLSTCSMCTVVHFPMWFSHYFFICQNLVYLKWEFKEYRVTSLVTNSRTDVFFSGGIFSFHFKVRM